MFFTGQYKDLARFSTATVDAPLSATLLALLNENYTDINTAVADVSKGLKKSGHDYSEAEIVEILSGDLVPDDNALEVLAQLCTDETGETIDEAKVTDLLNAAELTSALFDELEEAGESDEDTTVTTAEVDEDDYAEVYEDEDARDEANFSSYAVALAELKEKDAVKDALVELTTKADYLVANGQMPPIAFSLIFGENAKNPYAEFSSYCTAQEVSPIEHIGEIEFALDLFENLGAYIDFKVDETPETENYSFSKSDDSADEISEAVDSTYELFTESFKRS